MKRKYLYTLVLFILWVSIWNTIKRIWFLENLVSPEEKTDFSSFVFCHFPWNLSCCRISLDFRDSHQLQLDPFELAPAVRSTSFVPNFPWKRQSYKNHTDYTSTLQGVSKKTLFNEIGTPGGPKTIDRVGDQSKMLSNTLYWSDVPIYPF